MVIEAKNIINEAKALDDLYTHEEKLRIYR